MMKPTRPYFGSGPTVKPKPWSLSVLSSSLISRSHRSIEGLKAIQYLLALTREVLAIPSSHEIALVPGSATGAMQMAMWNLLGTRPVSLCTDDIFGKRWLKDIRTNMPTLQAHAYTSEPGKPVDFHKISFDHDILFLWNESTTGRKISSSHEIPEGRPGLVLCDATSAVYGMDIAWEKLDATAFSWQKGLGGEAGFGILVLGPKARDHLRNRKAVQSVPFILNLRGIWEKLIEGKTLNTISMLCLADAIWCHEWALEQGGLAALTAKSKKNLTLLEEWVNSKDPTAAFIPRFLVPHPSLRSSTTICLEIVSSQKQEWAYYQKLSTLLAQEQVAYDILNHSEATPCLRLWGGPTMETEDLEKLLPWLDFLLEKNQNHPVS